LFLLNIPPVDLSIQGHPIAARMDERHITVWESCSLTDEFDHIFSHFTLIRDESAGNLYQISVSAVNKERKRFRNH